MCCTIILVHNLSPGIRSRGLSVQYSVLYNHTSSQSVPWHNVERVVSTAQCIGLSYQIAVDALIHHGRGCQDCVVVVCIDLEVEACCHITMANLNTEQQHLKLVTIKPSFHTFRRSGQHRVHVLLLLLQNSRDFTDKVRLCQSQKTKECFPQPVTLSRLHPGDGMGSTALSTKPAVAVDAHTPLPELRKLTQVFCMCSSLPTHT